METINDEKKINRIGRQLDMNKLEQVTGGSTIPAGELRSDECGGDHYPAGTKRGYIVNEWGNVIGER